MQKKSVLVILAHPNFQKSRLNKKLVEALSGLGNVAVHKICGEYSSGKIDIEREHGLLRKAGVVVFQFPLYWYSTPPLLKEWQDEVLTFGFAFGEGGDALEGKDFFVSVTTGSPEKEFRADGHVKHTLEELLYPLEAVAGFCRMNYRKPFAVFNAEGITDDELEKKAGEYKELILKMMQDGN